ncbi:MAG TPA: CUAEP/CCAEP-tail radical SAM protein [candidate division Zixibacteria bacterium]|nr:CUAEP/CCAEP-tail radical SAM protein [candidate division Zixibacteria bacterium]
MAKVLLISTYELGHQPFGLASPAAWLNDAGADVATLDLAIESIEKDLVAQSDLIAIYLPMHTATRLAADLIPQIRQINAAAHLCCYGLYAPTNETFLRGLGVQTIIGGEFETGLVYLYHQLKDAEELRPGQAQPLVSMERQQFLVPERNSLPNLEAYAHLILPDGQNRTTGYTETTRGCKHTCRHCPIVPIYNGRFRIIQQEIVLADVRQQVKAGAQHITFGDPDFLNGPGHSMPIVQALNAEFPDLTYDVTIKVEHLLKLNELLPTLKDTGCIFITSAVEAVDDGILEILDKGHTRAGFEKAASNLRELGLVLNPTFVAFTPWTTREGYLEFLKVIGDLDLVSHISPIQYAIRLLIPAGSRLLELSEVQNLVEPYDHAALCYPWQHPDPVMDQLYTHIFRLIQSNQVNQESRISLFNDVWRATLDLTGIVDPNLSADQGWELAAAPVPRMSESWY